MVRSVENLDFGESGLFDFEVVGMFGVGFLDFKCKGKGVKGLDFKGKLKGKGVGDLDLKGKDTGVGGLALRGVGGLALIGTGKRVECLGFKGKRVGSLGVGLLVFDIVSYL